MKSVIEIHKYMHDKREEYNLDQTVDWIEELFSEVADGREQNGGYLNVVLSILRKEDSFLADHLIIRGEIDLNYLSTCVRCLGSAHQKLKNKFAVCFADQSLDQTPEFEQLTSVFCDDQDMDLYFYKNGKIDLKELIHEEIFLNLDHLPLHDENCKGLCPICGINLNVDKCSH